MKRYRATKMFREVPLWRCPQCGRLNYITSELCPRCQTKRRGIPLENSGISKDRQVDPTVCLVNGEEARRACPVEDY
jgi:uncharacterized OB-fold protein